MELANVANQNVSSNSSVILNALKGIPIQNTTSKQQSTNDEKPLKVALFPYIPDSGGDNFANLKKYFKDAFESVFKGFKVELHINLNANYYNLSLLADWLTNNVNGYDIVEIDTVLLGDLVNAGLIEPQVIDSWRIADWNSAAINAVEFNQAYYGYPHIQCAFYLITGNQAVSQSTTIDQLVQNLGAQPTAYHRIVGNLDSSWGLPALWLNSFYDSYNDILHTIADALHNYQDYRFDSLYKLTRLCDVSGQPNRCLDGTFKDPDRMTDLFIKNQAAAMFGYSERLFRIVKNGYPGIINDVKISPLPLGTLRNEPVFFTDAFVFRRNMSSYIKKAAENFVWFMAYPAFQAAFVASGDVASTKPIPRYLLPVSKSAYDQTLLKTDPIYQQIFRHFNSTSYPTAGFYNTRIELQAAILKYIR